MNKEGVKGLYRGISTTFAGITYFPKMIIKVPLYLTRPTFLFMNGSTCTPVD